MTGDPRDDALAAALSRLGEHHRPDSARIWQRVETAQRGPSPGWRAPRMQRPIAAGVAVLAVLGLYVGAGLLSRRAGERPPAQLSASAAGQASGPAPSPSAGVAADPTPTTGHPTPSARVDPSARPGSTPGPSPAGPAGPHAATTAITSQSSQFSQTSPASSASRAPEGLPSLPLPLPSPASPIPTPIATLPAPSPRQESPAPTPRVARLAPLTSPADRTLDLRTPVLLDWVALGQRKDGKQVRAKRPGAGGGMIVSTGFNGSLLAGPLTVGWSDGLPEQTRSSSRTWLKESFGQTVTVSLPPAAVARQLIVHLGGVNVSLAVAVTGHQYWYSGDPLVSGTAYALTIDVPAGSTPVVVAVTGVAQAPNAYTTVAAVTLVDASPA